MTLPHEELRSLNYAFEFLCDLIDPASTPRVPLEIRQRASRILRHYPWSGAREEAWLPRINDNPTSKALYNGRSDHKAARKEVSEAQRG